MSAPQWAADVAIDVALASRLVRSQFHEFAHATVAPFGVGWDNAAFLVNDRVVVRFPRRRAATRLLEREIALLPLLGPHLPLAIPVPRYVGAPSREYPYPFAGYERIVGRTACAVDFDGAADRDAARARDCDEAPMRSDIAAPLGTFLRALHAIDPAPLVARGLPSDDIGRLDHVRRMKLTRERAPSLAEPAAVAATGVSAETIARVVTWLDAHPPRRIDASARRCVHGDLYPRHVLIDDGRAVGIIDWGDLHLGDPAIDLAIAHAMLPASAHAAFRAAYGAIDDDAWRTARYRAAYHALLELDYGVREGDRGMLAIGAAALRLMTPF